MNKQLGIARPESHSQVPVSLETQAVIFDRDGVLIQNLGFVHRLEQIHWVDGALELLRVLRERSVLALVATNQSGVARGYFGLDDVNLIHARLASDAAAKGGEIAAFEVCPHLASGSVPPYNVACECRKPKPGMLISLVHRFGLDPGKVTFVGDQETDLQAAKAAGVMGAQFKGGNLSRFCLGDMA
jgi:D-glycero-D-manno-heptose 1,7-bisphosphate phosphatase